MTDSTPHFEQLGLPENILKAVKELGYETPSPIQAQAIPTLLSGKDILGQAQTGTGKTAAFALPVLANIDPKKNETQVLVLAPTRELAIQVAEACQSYAKHMKGFNVLPIYGGQSYTNQLRQLKRGAQVVVGTPGRVMDHMRRETLKLNNLKTLVLDEADEMLRMGFIDDVEWILEHTPEERQIALFSATMPREIKKVAQNHLNDPEIIKIADKTATAKTINQRYMMTTGIDKLEALTRVLEMESYDGVIIFVRTKLATEELATKLNARGYSASALNGDIPQAAREKTVERLKKGSIDILIGTDVVARGLDVDRISHVINFDVPYDTEAYVHRIGRTGRAGRSGEAILFITPREKRMLRSIEKATSQAITRMDVPTANVINQIRVDQFKQNILELLESSNITFFQEIIEDLMEESSADPVKIAATLAHLNNGNRPFLLDPKNDRKINKPERERESRDKDSGQGGIEKLKAAPRPLKDHPDVKLVRYRLDVGYKDNVKPGNIVGAIANTADIDSEYIGQIEIYNSFSTVDLPDGMPKSVLSLLKAARVSNKPINLRLFSIDDVNEKSLRPSPSKRPTKPRSNRKSSHKPDRKGKANRKKDNK